MFSKTFFLSLLLSSSALARTDLEGCTSFTTMVTVRPEPGFGNTYASVVWYVPDTLEICKFVDCGGGRAPPKNVPGCPRYQGTETVTPEFLKQDPMKPTQAATSQDVKETGTVVTQGSSAVAASGMATTTEPAKNEAATTAASTSESKQAEDKATSAAQETGNQASESNSAKGTGAETPAPTTAGGQGARASTTSSNRPNETGAAAAVAANVFAGAAAAMLAIL